MKIGIGPAIAGKLTSQVAMVAIFATATVGGVSLISSSVFATLDATATYTSQGIDNGTLLLTQAADTNTSSAGFTSSISLLAPQDVVNRYVAVTNGGTLDGSTLTLKATSTVTNAGTLPGDLTITAQACSSAWTLTVGGSTCGGTASTAATGTLASFSTAKSLGLSLAASGVTYVKLSVALSNITETIDNGAFVIGTSHEGQSTSVTWQFSEPQRTNTTTNG
ncbi:MAG: hypothetical protein WCO08_06050 [Actinomycetes bacterium]